jgi:soluble lytic murein transglycosylase-like protein
MTKPKSTIIMMAVITGIILGACALAFASSTTFTASSTAHTPCANVSLAKIRATYIHAVKWSAIFDVPVTWLMALACIESDHDPKLVNPRRGDKGGAWGLMQQMADEASWKIQKIARFWHRSPDVQRVLRRYYLAPFAETLLDPELSLMLAAWQLRRLGLLFGRSFEIVAVGYHQGEGALAKRLSRGQLLTDSQPRGQIFLRKALLAHAQAIRQVHQLLHQSRPKALAFSTVP